VDLARLLAHRTAPTRRRQRPARAFEHVRAKEAFFAVPGNSLHLHVVGHGGSANGSNRQRQANGRCALRTHSLGAPLPALHGLGTRPDGGVVTQRTANPCTPVRFRLGPPLPSSFSRTTRAAEQAGRPSVSFGCRATGKKMARPRAAEPGKFGRGCLKGPPAMAQRRCCIKCKSCTGCCV